MTVNHHRRHLIRLAAASAFSVAGLPARAGTGQVYFGFQSGPLVNGLADILLPRLAGQYRQPFDTKLTHLPGNGSARAFEALKNGPDDGSSMILAPSEMLTVLPLVRPSAGFEPMTDLAPIAPLIEFAFAFCVGPAVPADVKTLDDYKRWVSDTPNRATYGVPALGTGPHFFTVLMARSIGVPLRAVPYQGNAPLVKDLIGAGQPAGMVQIGIANEAFKSGALRPLFVVPAKRWPGLPDVPTLREATGITLAASSTYGFFARASTPAAKVKELNEAICAVLRGPEMAAFTASTSTTPLNASPAEFAAELAAARRSWAQAIAKEGFTLDS